MLRSNQLSYTTEASNYRPKKSLVHKIGFAFAQEGVHAFFLVLRGKQCVEQAALKHHAIGQRLGQGRRLLQDGVQLFTAQSARGEGLAPLWQVQAAGEVLTVRVQHAHPQLGIAIQLAIGEAHAVPQREIEGVALAGAIQADEQDVAAAFHGDGAGAVGEVDERLVVVVDAGGAARSEAALSASDSASAMRARKAWRVEISAASRMKPSR